MLSERDNVSEGVAQGQLCSVDGCVCDVCMCVVVFSGILYGTMTLELGGKITIECEQTRYAAELEFKLKVQLSSGPPYPQNLHLSPGQVF